MYDVIIVIPDLHAPWQHPDTIPFLKKVKQMYFPFGRQLVVSIGDEVDYAKLSFHTSSPNIGVDEVSEYAMAKLFLQKLYQVFPEMTVLKGNHTIMPQRKAEAAGIPDVMLKSFPELYETPSWKWVNELVVDTVHGPVKFKHQGGSANVLNVSKTESMSFVQGHYHTKFNLTYWGTPESLKFAMQMPTLIDDEQYAFKYNKTSAARPMLGCGVIVNGIPLLIPMITKNGRWVGNDV